MRISRNTESGKRPLSTADLASAAQPAADEQRRASQVEDDRDNTLRTEDGDTRGEERIARTSDTRPDLPPVSVARSEEDEFPMALFTPELTETYRSRWISIQSSFVDDPKQAVRSGDELVAQVMTNLANSFSEERHRVEAQLDETGEGSTENLRVALRRYRSFFDRLLSL